MRLRVVLAPDNIRRLDILENLTLVEHLKTILKERLEIKDDFLIQFEDPEFGNELCNLTNITELPPERAVLKILQKVPEDSEPETSISSLDTASVSSPYDSSNQSFPFVSVRQHGNSQWPSPFPIPKFYYNELRLEKGNGNFKEDGTLLTVSREMKMEILDSIAQAIFSFKAYPNNQELESVSAALIEKYPCLKDSGSGTGYHSWTMSIKYKVGNYHQKQRTAGCSEVTVNQKRVNNDSRCLKKAKRCEINFLPDNPVGQTDYSLQREKDALQEEMKKKHFSMAVVDSKMDLTFSLRRKEIVDEEPLVADVLKQWPALFLEDQVCAEFYRITQTNLKSTFLSSLDEYASKMIMLYRSRGGAYRDEMKTLLDQFDQVII
uniref:Sterile alpha motif domain-containing protein 3 n=1 Tax=Cyprinus carpio carpio TaxID=630221 RepID=A0A9J7Y220_CYPCA